MRSSAAKPTGTASSDRALYAAASLSLVAALIHLWVMPEHFEEWWGYGTFFLATAAAQLLYVPLLLRWPSRTVLLAGIAGNLAIVVLYLLTRTVGIPLLGPEAGKVEGVGLADLGATTSEMGIALALGAVLLRDTTPERRRTVLLVVPSCWCRSGTWCTCCCAPPEVGHRWLKLWQAPTIFRGELLRITLLRTRGINAPRPFRLRD